MIKAIIFDIDGTLIDSFEANFEFFNNLMTKAGYKSFTKEEYVPLFHRTFRNTVQILTGVTDEVEIKRITDLMDEVDSPPPIITSGVPETIKILSQGYILAVVTSRIKAYAYEAPLNTLEHYFKATVAYEDSENHKPHPEPLLLAAKQLNVLPEECVYVGDVKNDMDAARTAGMKFILFSREIVDGVDVRTDDFKQIPDLITTLRS